MAYNTDTTGNAATATKLATARTISGVSFDGTADIGIPSMSGGFYGWKSWVFDPILITNALNLTTAGVIYLTRLPWPSTDTITNIITRVDTQGSALTTGQCFAGIYDSSGNLVAATGDQSTAWSSTGIKTMELVGGPYSVSGGGPTGFIYVAYLFNGTTGPTIPRGTPTSAVGNNFGLPVGSYRTASILSGRTSLPSSLTLSNQAGHAVTYWAAVS